MNDRTYDRIANVLMLVAVASALMFDVGVLPRIVVGAFGGIAALASALLYFRNQSASHTAVSGQPVSAEIKAKEKRATPMMTEGPSFSAPHAAREVTDRWLVMLAQREKQYIHVAYALHHHRYANLKLADRAFYGGALVHHDIEETNVVLSPDDVAACAIEIIQQLSKKDGDDRWEFHFGANGLRVSAKKRHTEPESIRSQEDFDFFGNLPPTTLQ